jgi:hypothetical protein
VLALKSSLRKLKISGTVAIRSYLDSQARSFKRECKGIANYISSEFFKMLPPAMDGESDGPSNTLFMKTLPFGTSEIDVRPRAS